MSVVAPADLVAHLCRTSPLTPGEAARIVADIVGYYSESPQEFVRRRHTEMQARGGLTNDKIFERIAAELTGRLVAAPEYTQRQLRRIVYT